MRLYLSPLAPATLPADRPQGWKASTPVALLVLAGLIGSVTLLPRHLALLLVLAPVIEELIFRAGLQETLLRRGWRPWPANLLTTLAFVLLHGFTRSWPLAAAVLLPSLVLGRLYQGTRRLGPVVALHAAMNLFWVAVGTSAIELFPFFQ
jgi:membrane protease YdiL (CAAX protease family)